MNDAADEVTGILNRMIGRRSGPIAGLSDRAGLTVQGRAEIVVIMCVLV